MNATPTLRQNDDTQRKAYPDERIYLRQASYLLSAVITRIRERETPHKKTRVKASENAVAHGSA